MLSLPTSSATSWSKQRRALPEQRDLAGGWFSPVSSAIKCRPVAEAFVAAGFTNPRVLRTENGARECAKESRKVLADAFCLLIGAVSESVTKIRPHLEFAGDNRHLVCVLAFGGFARQDGTIEGQGLTCYSIHGRDKPDSKLGDGDYAVAANVGAKVKSRCHLTLMCGIRIFL